MTATPIPRTLALTGYGDLDVTVLRELPRGRQPIQTFVCSTERERARAYERIREELRAGRQAFVVCPLVEESEVLQARAATAEFERLRTGELRDFGVVLLHGQMRPRGQAGGDGGVRRRGGADVLVATSVIEVGIDVPNATVMLVEDAERYGISQLHQLRGRIGRGEHPSLCLLFGAEGVAAAARRWPTARRRLRAGRDRPRAARARASWSARASPGSRSSASPSCPRTPTCSSARTPTPSGSRPGSGAEPTRARAARRRAADGPRRRGAPTDPGLSGRRAGDRRTAARAALSAPRGAATRPTADRVREALFSILGDGRRRARARPVRRLRARWASRRSRAARPGPRSSTRSPAAIAPIRRNLEALGIDAEVRRQDARAFLRNARAAARQYDLVFLDPPYRHASALGHELSTALAPLLAPEARVVAESDRRAPLELGLELLDERRYGDTLIRIHGTR